MIRSSLRALVAGCLLALAAPASAQPQMPGMPDPSAMSGIPRPDSTVRPGKLVVRVIRGDFAHPMVGAEVVLDGPGGSRTARVADDGRANFEGLPIGGPYRASATKGEQTVGSQPIDLPAEVGVKVMLVFKPDEKAALAEHDGVARPDKSLPAGTLVISVHGEGDQPLANLPVTVSHGSQAAPGAQPKIEQTVLTTDDKGEARYVAPGSKEGLMVSVRKDPLSADSQPLQLDAASGMRLGLRATAISRDAQAVVINRKSHLILDVKDETVEVIENLTIENRAASPYDPGKAGLVFVLPEGAQGAQQVGEPSNAVTVAGQNVLVRGPLPPGETTFAVGFVLAQKEGAVDLRQTMPVRMEQLLAITSRFPGVEVRGDGITKIDREMNGRTFYVLQGREVPAGGTLRLGLAGLPHRSPWASHLAVAIAVLIGLWGLVASLGGAGSGEKSERERLQAEKRQLLDELAANERGKAGTAKAESRQARRHDELMERLERVLRDLDDQPTE